MGGATPRRRLPGGGARPRRGLAGGLALLRRPRRRRRRARQRIPSCRRPACVSTAASCPGRPAAIYLPTPAIPADGPQHPRLRPRSHPEPLAVMDGARPGPTSSCAGTWPDGNPLLRKTVGMVAVGLDTSRARARRFGQALALRGTRPNSKLWPASAAARRSFPLAELGPPRALTTSSPPSRASFGTLMPRDAHAGGSPPSSPLARTSRTRPLHRQHRAHYMAAVGATISRRAALRIFSPRDGTTAQTSHQLIDAAPLDD